MGWRISGRVQGVGFRWFVRQHALRLGVPGAVRNLPDGSVEVLARAEPLRLEALRQQLESGPRSGRVERIELLEVHENAEFDGFEIRP